MLDGMRKATQGLIGRFDHDGRSRPHHRQFRRLGHRRHVPRIGLRQGRRSRRRRDHQPAVPARAAEFDVSGPDPIEDGPDQRAGARARPRQRSAATPHRRSRARSARRVAGPGDFRRRDRRRGARRSEPAGRLGPIQPRPLRRRLARFRPQRARLLRQPEPRPICASRSNSRWSTASARPSPSSTRSRGSTRRRARSTISSCRRAPRATFRRPRRTR